MGILTGPCYSGMVHRAKPDPEIYLKACEAIGARPERCIALEDARRESVCVCGRHDFLYDSGSEVEPDEEIKALVHRQFKTLHEVIGLLEQMDIRNRRNDQAFARHSFIL